MKYKPINSNAGGDILRALRHRNYRLFFGGQLVSFIGTWIQQLAMSWLAYRITRSSFLLGIIGFTGQIPSFFLAPFAGVVADRFNRHRILIITQTLAMLQAFFLAILLMTRIVTFPWLIGLSLFLGLINAFDAPVRQSFIVQMVDDREDLGNAIALNSTLINVARMIGPSLAGILIALVGEEICFLLNGFSYTAVIWALLLMKLKPEPVKEKEADRPWLTELQEGFQYVFSFPPLRSIILLIGLISLAGMSYTVVIPAYVKEILNGGANTQGFLMGAVGLGSALAAVFLASRKNITGLEIYIPVAAGIVAFGLIGFSMARSLWAALLLLFIVGTGMIMAMISANSVVQTIVEESRRGRVMSIYIMSFVGMGPFGNLLAGSLAHVIGTPNTFLMMGLLTLAGAVVFTSQIGKFYPMIQAIYLKLGLFEERTPDE
jgi:MFS family permease